MLTFLFTPLQLSFTTHPRVIVAGNLKKFKKIPNDNGSLEYLVLSDRPRFNALHVSDLYQNYMIRFVHLKNRNTVFGLDFPNGPNRVMFEQR